jgi:hypothetical protein
MVAWALTALAGLYVALVWAATRAAGPQNWGLHSAAFLSPFLEYALLLAMTAAVVALGIAAGGWIGPRPAKRPRAHAKTHRKRTPQPPERRSARVPLWLLALPVYGALLHLLRTRTHFLGDGGVWLNMLLGGTIDPFSEPLSAAVWRLYRAVARAAGFPMAGATFAFLPVLCGVAFAGLAWLFLGEALPRASRGLRALAWGLLLTMGITQLYYGYIESYPIASVAVLAYLWLALRHARGADLPWLLPVASAVRLDSTSWRSCSIRRMGRGSKRPSTSA